MSGVDMGDHFVVLNSEAAALSVPLAFPDVARAPSEWFYDKAASDSGCMLFLLLGRFSLMVLGLVLRFLTCGSSSTLVSYS